MNEKQHEVVDGVVRVAGCPLCTTPFASLDATGSFALGAQMEALLSPAGPTTTRTLHVRDMLCLPHAEGFDRVIDDVRELVVSELMTLLPVEGSS